MSAPRILGITACLAFLLFFRCQFAFSAFGSLDPHCYLEHLYRLLGQPTESCPSRSFLPGTALLWAPGGFLAVLVAKITGAGVDHLIRLSVGFSSFFLWVGSLFLVHATLNSTRKVSAWTSVAWVLLVPVLYYAAVRTTLSHAAEFFLACLTAWAIVKDRQFPALTAAAVLCFVRYNSLPWLFIVGAAAFALERRRSWWALWGASVLIFGGHALRIGFGQGYNEVTLPFLAHAARWSRAGEVLFGSDWGLFWMSPWWLMVLVAGALCLRRLSLREIACWLAMGVNLILCISWRGNGSDFGYRYLIGTYPAALLLWMSLEPKLPSWRALSRGAALWGAVWTTYLTWLYRTQSAFTPTHLTDDWGAVLPAFQEHALEALLNPRVLFAPFQKVPAAALWCGWRACESLPASLFGAQWWATALALSGALIFLAWRSDRSRLPE